MPRPVHHTQKQWWLEKESMKEEPGACDGKFASAGTTSRLQG
jgi:hypothetical protein